MWALEHGVTLALANKESLVAAGDLALAAQERGGGRLIPVDSEHSALFQCAQLGEPESLVLTASGGPFRGRSRDELADITPEQALAHPTWTMGAKITIDSATLANKGLEVIEAHFLFGLPYDRIEVVVHPTSIVHGLVRFRDGAAIAHLGLPDMRVPISYALTYPDRAKTPVPTLDLTAGPLEFFEPDTDTFRLLALAREAGERGGTYPCAFNAANEVAVAAFLAGRIGFLDIAALGGGRARPDGRRTGARSERAARGGLARPRGGGAGMGVVAAILGLAILVMIHEAGHFFAARAVGMTPRKFYLGFGPPIAKTTRGGVEYGIGSIPLGGYVKIPGMNRPSPGDLAATLAPRTASATARSSRGSTTRSSVRTTRRPRLPERVAAGARRDAHVAGARVVARAGCVLAADDVAPADSHLRGAGRQPRLRSRAVRVPLHGRSRTEHERDRARRHRQPRGRRAREDRATGSCASPARRCRRRHPSAHPRDERAAVPDPRPAQRQASRARAAAREGRQRRLPDRDRDRGAHRPRRVTACSDPRRVEADVEHHCRDGAGIGHLATGRDTDQVSSSVGIVRVSAQAWRQGARDFLFVLGLVSLALGLLNLLPVLPLDGGHIVMALVEKVRGRTFRQAVYVRYSVFGLMLFAVLMYFGLRNDLFGGGG